MDWLTGFTGSLTGVLNGVTQAATQVQNTVQNVNSALHPTTSTLAPVGGITYGPYFGNGASIDGGTLALIGLAAYLLLR